MHLQEAHAECPEHMTTNSAVHMGPCAAEGHACNTVSHSSTVTKQRPLPADEHAAAAPAALHGRQCAAKLQLHVERLSRLYATSHPPYFAQACSKTPPAALSLFCRGCLTGMLTVLQVL